MDNLSGTVGVSRRASRFEVCSKSDALSSQHIARPQRSIVVASHSLLVSSPGAIYFDKDSGKLMQVEEQAMGCGRQRRRSMRLPRGVQTRRVTFRGRKIGVVGADNRQLGPSFNSEFEHACALRQMAVHSEAERRAGGLASAPSNLCPRSLESSQTQSDHDISINSFPLVDLELQASRALVHGLHRPFDRARTSTSDCNRVTTRSCGLKGS